jgi:protein-S-isoprenylcysteine O-methyltransferase Ste14
MNLESLESVIHWLGGLLSFTILGIILYGVYRGFQRQAGRTTGHASGWLRSSWFYLLIFLLFFGLAVWGWKPLPLTYSTAGRVFMLITGSLLYFPGLLIVLWGRQSLGKQYFVSTGFSAQLFQDHQLVTGGPYAYLRHPMYLGVILTAVGSLLLYHTWTTVFFVCFAPFMILRARREDSLLAQEFGDQWKKYSQNVPAFIPRLKSHRNDQ